VPAWQRVRLLLGGGDEARGVIVVDEDIELVFRAHGAPLPASTIPNKSPETPIQPFNQQPRTTP